MFYWSRGETHIVLTDEEVNVLLGEVSNDPVERVQYRTSQRIRADLERRMSRYLEKNLRVFPMFLDAYGRATKRATIGQYGKLASFDDLPDQVAYAGSSRV